MVDRGAVRGGALTGQNCERVAAVALGRGTGRLGDGRDNLILPQGMKGREEVLVSGQRMENVPQKPGRWGSRESCCTSGDLGLHLLPVSTFATGGMGSPRTPLPLLPSKWRTDKRD